MLPPFDIVDHIFSFLSEDLHSLEKCSKADPGLASTAQRYIHRHIIISNRFTRRERGQSLQYTCPQIKTLLSKSPLVANYVQTLEIHAHHQTRSTLRRFKNEIIPLLPKFSGLRCIALVWPVAWSLLSADFIAALGRCIRLPSLTEVRFSGTIVVPLDLLDNWKNIKSLSFTPPNLVVAGLHSEPVPNTTDFQLESLSLLSSNRVVLDVISWAKKHVRNLRSLSLRDLIYMDLLKICSTTLTSLSLDFHCITLQTEYNYGIINPPPTAPFDLSFLPHLQELSICANVTKRLGYTCYRSSLPTVIALLKTSPPLQRLVLEFMFWGATPSTLPRMNLLPLNGLANSPCFSSHLIEIRMRASLDVTICVPAATTLSYLVAGHEGLMRLYSRGVLVIPEQQPSDSEFL